MDLPPLQRPSWPTCWSSAEVPGSRVYTIADIYQDPHFAARHMLVQVPHPRIGHTTQVGVVPRLSATPGRIRHTGHDIGADTEAVLRDELGLTRPPKNQETT
jgi:crotonobetainyl-CoA:carnitine CoA-transferase CaiB-like acyl-CoA transferase